VNYAYLAEHPDRVRELVLAAALLPVRDPVRGLGVPASDTARLGRLRREVGAAREAGRRATLPAEGLERADTTGFTDRERTARWCIGITSLMLARPERWRELRGARRSTGRRLAARSTRTLRAQHDSLIARYLPALAASRVLSRPSWVRPTSSTSSRRGGTTCRPGCPVSGWRSSLVRGTACGSTNRHGSPPSRSLHSHARPPAEGWWSPTSTRQYVPQALLLVSRSSGRHPTAHLLEEVGRVDRGLVSGLGDEPCSRTAPPHEWRRSGPRVFVSMFVWSTGSRESIWKPMLAT
jgi:hypothetical protein